MAQSIETSTSRHAFGNQQARRGVTEIVEPDPREFGRVEDQSECGIHPSLANQLKAADPTEGVPVEVQKSFVLAECAVDLRPRDVRDGSDRKPDR